MSRAGLGVVAGFALAAGIVACASLPAPQINHRDQKNDITALWTQIRAWRREAHMDVEPPDAVIQAVRGKSVHTVARTCPDAHVPPPACSEICGLADAICDNAESICRIADELGGDPWARQKCDSAKASCKEAKEVCCACDTEAPTAPSKTEVPL